MGQEAGESLVIIAAGLLGFHGREKEPFITCLYPLLVRRDQWWPNFHRAGYFPHEYFTAPYACFASSRVSACRNRSVKIEKNELSSFCC